MRNPFRYFNGSPEVNRLTEVLYIRYPLSLCQVEDILFERGLDICRDTVRLWWNRFGPMFAAQTRRRRVHLKCYSQWRWHVDEVFIRINGRMFYLWRAVDHEGEVLEAYASKRRDRKAAALRPYTLFLVEEVKSGDWVVGGQQISTSDVHAIHGCWPDPDR